MSFWTIHSHSAPFLVWDIFEQYSLERNSGWENLRNADDGEHRWILDFGSLYSVDELPFSGDTGKKSKEYGDF